MNNSAGWLIINPSVPFIFHIGQRMENNVKILLMCLVFLIVATTSCAQSSHSDIYKIHELCRKEKSDPTVIEKMKLLGIDLDRDEHKFFQPKSRTDFDFIHITLNPQPTYNNIQGIFITWNESSELKYEEIQGILGIRLPDRGSKEIVTDQGLDKITRYYVLGYRFDSARLPINQITFTCKKNNYDVCWEATISCHDYIHPESD